MIRDIDVTSGISLSSYEEIPEYQLTLSELRTETTHILPQLKGRTIWMVNSTDKGGGVAEMLPRMVSIFRELGIGMNWVVIDSDKEEFFAFTKRLHNMIHGTGRPGISEAEKSVYEAVNRANADALKGRIAPNDILIVHDPQPMAMGAYLQQELGILTIWRCHIGTDVENDATASVWQFLKAYSGGYTCGVFSAPEYIPPFFAGHSHIIHPAIDPLSHKNRPLTPRRLMGILCNAQIEKAEHPVVTLPFPQPALRLRSDGQFQVANQTDSFGLLYRPIVTQISRWDRLKGFLPLIQGFVRLKQQYRSFNHEPKEIEHRRFEIMKLVLAGPDPTSIQDDPEGKEVLEELKSCYCSLDAKMQESIALLALPMASLKFNALMVNALQRCSTIVFQNSIQEGFGLTVTEAMWKGVAIIGTNCVGIRQQIRDGIDGRLLDDPQNIDQIAHLLYQVLNDAHGRMVFGENARRHAYNEFLVFTQIRRWLRLMAEVSAHAALLKS